MNDSTARRLKAVLAKRFYAILVDSTYPHVKVMELAKVSQEAAEVVVWAIEVVVAEVQKGEQ